jgi:transcriptional regulator with XRE-family HTH domain
MEFGQRMRAKRKALGLTLAELGEKVGVSSPNLSKIERGQAARRGTLAKIKGFLGLRGGVSVGKAKKAPRRPRKAPAAAKVPSTVMDAIATLIVSIDRLRASVDTLREDLKWVTPMAVVPPPTPDCRPSPDLSLVPSVEEQRAKTEEMTRGIAKNGLRRPLRPYGSNSLDPVVGARLMPEGG